MKRTARKAIVIHSPRSGRSEQLEQALDCLRQEGLEIVNIQPISALDGLPPQGEQWRTEGIEIVIAAGGDGLVGGVTSHIVASGLPMGILPLGTANDIARTLKLPLDIPQAARVIANGRPQAIDIGVAHPAEQTPNIADIPASEQAYFVHALTVGLNVKFAQLATDKALRQQFGRFTYPFAVAEALRTYQPVDLELTFDRLAIYTQNHTQYTLREEPVVVRSRVAQATVVNAPVFWGAFEARVPGVSLNDRLLDIVIIEDASIERLVTNALHFFNHQEHQQPDKESWQSLYPELFAAELTNIPGIHHVQARGVTITTKTNPQHATLDGEVRGLTPIQVCVADQQLKVITDGQDTTS